MAGRRLARSTVDWAKFAENVPEPLKDKFVALKTKSDTFVSQVTSLAEKRPELNIAGYKGRAPALAAIIDQFAQKYSAVDIPYPKDLQNFAKLADEKRSKLESDAKSIVSESNKRLQVHKVELSKWDRMPPIEHMSIEEWNHYFPEYKSFDREKPSFNHSDDRPEDADMVPRQMDYKIAKGELH